MKLKILLSALIALSVNIVGCSVFSSEKTTVVLPYSPLLLNHLQQARDLVAESRYELAKEQYLMALSASTDVNTTQTVTEELHAVDLMIKTQR